GKLEAHVSLPIGTGKVIAQSGLRNPCPEEAVVEAQRYIKEMLRPVTLRKQAGAVAVASGGVARGLWRAVHPDGEKTIFSKELEYLEWSTARLSLDRIGSRFGVKQRRAQTLLPGSMVYK